MMLDTRSESGFLSPSGFIEEEPLISEDDGTCVSPVSLTDLSVYPFVCLCVCLSLYLCLSVCLFVCLSVCLFVCLSVCLSV